MPRKTAKSQSAVPPPPQTLAGSPSSAASPVSDNSLALPARDEKRSASSDPGLGGPSHLGVQRIVSGGQTGVDRGALDAAIALQIEHGGWCPRGRMAEDGPIPARYALRETDEVEYAVRTERNVIDSSGTLLLYKGRLQRGTLLTDRLARKHARPVLRVRLDQPIDVPKIQQWIIRHGLQVLNVAGPRASSCPGIDGETTELLKRLFSEALPRTLFDEPA